MKLESQLQVFTASGVAPFTVNRATLVSNLNAQYLNGQLGGWYQDAANLNVGTLLAARLPAFTGDVSSTVGTVGLTLASVGTAGTYRSVTTDAKGRVTAGTNPTTLAGYGITDAIDISAVAQTKSGNLTVSSALTSGGNFYAATTVQYSNRQQIYTVNYGGAQDLAWKKIADVIVPSGLYRGITFKIDVVDNQGNFGWNSNCFTLTYFASCIRSGGVQDDFNNANVTGPVADYVRVVKTATGIYELQIRQLADWQTYIFTAEATINSGGCTVTYASTNPANGSTIGTIYNATATAAAGWTSKLANIAVAGVSSFAGQITSTIATGTAPLVIASTTLVSNLNAQYLNGQLGTWYQDASNLSAGTLLAARMPAHTGDVTSTVGTVGLTLANSGATAGTYTKVTVDVKGRVTAGAALASADLPTYTGTITGSQVTTGLGYTPYNSSNPNNYITASASITGYSGGVSSSDTRSVVTTPQTINAGVVFDFKANTTDSLSDGGSYFGEMTFRPYGSGTDWSGTISHQLGFTDAGNIWQRSGSSTTWAAWKKMLDSSNYSSYALPLAGGTLSGSITATNHIGPGTGLTGTATSLNIGGNAATATTSTRLSDATNGLRITNPGGGSYATGASLVTGAIKIKLPTASFASNTMLRFTVRIYEYAGDNAGLSRTIEVGGYNYSDAAYSWYNVFAYQDTMGGAEINVRFGNDGTSQCVWIGEVATVWNYPQVTVTDFQGGYSQYTDAVWATGWAISFAATFGTISRGPIIIGKPINSQNYTSYPPARWATGRTISLTGDVTGTSVAFDGTAALSFAATLANSGATAGTYNNVTVNAKGLVTGGSNASYLTSNQSISITGDATGSGSTGIVLTLANVLATPGTYTKVTVNAKGLVTAGAALASADLPTYTGTITSGQVTTGLGFTPYNASNPNNYITASASITGNAATATNGFSVKPDWAFAANLISDLSNFNNSVPSGFYQYSSATNSPGTSWYNLINVRHSNTGNDHGFQLAMSYYADILWSRSYQGGTGVNNGTFTTWRAHLHSGNFNSYALPLAGGTLTGALNGTTASFSTKVLSSRFHDSGDAFLFRSGSGTGTTRHLNLADTNADPSNNTGGTGITWGERGDNNPYYLIYPRYSNNGVSTHNRLAIAWHTGIEIGAHPSFGGTRFFNNSPFTGAEIFSVGNGDSNVRVVNTLYIGGNTALHAANYNSYALPLTGGAITGAVSIIGQTVNGQTHFQWSGASFQNAGDWTASLIVRKDNATVGINGHIPSLVLYNNNGGDQTTVGLSFASAEGATGQGNAVPLAGIVARKEGAGTVGNWSSGSLNIYVKNGSARVDALNISSTGTANFPVGLQQGGNQVLHAGNVATYAFAKSGAWAADLVSGYGYTRETGMQMSGGSEFVVLSKSGQGYLLVDGSYIAAEAGGFYSTNNSSGGTLLGFTADTTTSLNFNTTAVKLNGNQVLHAGNYNSYALPLSGGTLTGGLSGTTGTFSGTLNASGNVGIGTTTNTFTLNVYNNADVWHARFGSATGELRIGGQTSSGAVIQSYTPAGAVRDLYIQRDGGNLGVGTIDFSYTINDNTRVVGSNTNNKLFVNGSIQLLGNNDAIVFGRGTSTFLTDEELGFGWGGGWYMTDGTHLRVRNNKTLYTTGEIWASVFKDANDVAYFLDPAGTSNLNQWTTLTAARLGRSRYWTNRASITGDENYHTGTNGWGVGEGTWASAWKGGFSGWDIWGASSDHPQGAGYIHAQGIVSGLHTSATDGSSAHGWMMVGAHGATENRYWLRGKWGASTSGWVEMLTTGNASYAYNMNQNVGTGNSPSFTGLSVINTITGAVSGSSGSCTGNAASASSLAANTNTIFRVIRFTGEGYDSGNGAYPTNYGIYQEGGSWTYPYPDLCIGFHTGIKIGAQTGYGGIRFYNTETWGTEIFSVGNGDNNVRVVNTIYAAAFSGPLTGNVTGNVTGSAGSVAWTNVSGRPTAVSSFSNDSGYITSGGSISGSSGSCSGNAASVTDGVYLSNNQSISGVKTFSSAPVATNIAKAWVYYNMNNNTIYASYNVSSVTDNGTGVCTVNFSSAMVDANYVVAGTATYGYDDQDIHAMILAVPRRSTAQQAGSCRLATEYIHAAGVYDSVAVRAVFYR